MNNQNVLAAAPDHIADARKMVATAAQGEPEGVRSLLVECERALCCPDPAQRQVTASKILRMLAASTAPAAQGEPAAYISHTSEGDILGWERQFDAPSHTPLYAAPQPAPAVQGEPKIEPYDAGSLNDFGGGDVGWWHDYIRAELDRAYEFYLIQLSAAPQPAPTTPTGGER